LGAPETTAETAMKLPPKLARVPAFPPVAARLLSLLGRENISLEEVAALIATDALFSGRILQAANSIEFGCTQRVTNLTQALLLLGLDRTRGLAVSLATAAYLRNALRAENLRRCWRHTVACAMLAESIARALGRFVDQAYTAGILHDIGRLGLVVAFPNEYEHAIRDAAQRSVDMLDYERELFGIAHTEAGRLLVNKWQLPEPFPEIAGRHHDRQEGGEIDLLAIVSMACRLADELGFEVTKPLKPATVEEILAPLPEAVRFRLQHEAPAWRAAIERRVNAFEGTGEADPAASAESAGEADGGEFELDLAALPVAPVERVNLYLRAAGWIIAVVLIGVAAVLLWR
jgi:putative nucleotidyltransferase with HDIG domain